MEPLTPPVAPSLILGTCPHYTARLSDTLDVRPQRVMIYVMNHYRRMIHWLRSSQTRYDHTCHPSSNTAIDEFGRNAEPTLRHQPHDLRQWRSRPAGTLRADDTARSLASGGGGAFRVTRNGDIAFSIRYRARKFFIGGTPVIDEQMKSPAAIGGINNPGTSVRHTNTPN